LMEQTAVTTLMTFLSKCEPETIYRLVLLLTMTPLCMVALVFVFWFANERRRAQMLEIYREDMRTILDKYGADQRELREMYEANVKLVVAWEKIAGGFQDTVVLNTQTMQRMVDMCVTHQFCPQARLPK